MKNKVQKSSRAKQITEKNTFVDKTNLDSINETKNEI